MILMSSHVGKYNIKTPNIKTAWVNVTGSGSATMSLVGNTMSITVDSVDNLGGNDFLAIMSPINAQNTGTDAPFGLEIKSDALGSTCTFGYGLAGGYTLVASTEFDMFTAVKGFNSHTFTGTDLPLTSRDNYVLLFDNVSVGDVITVNSIQTSYSIDLLPETWLPNHASTVITYVAGILKIASNQNLYSAYLDMSGLIGQTYTITTLAYEYRENGSISTFYTDESKPPTLPWKLIENVASNEGSTYVTALNAIANTETITNRWFFDSLRGTVSVNTDIEFMQLKFIIKY